MNDETKKAVWIIGQWLLGSIPSGELDRLFECMNDGRLESDFKQQIADELRISLGYEAFG